MKKIFISFLLFALLFTSVLVLTGCEKGENGNENGTAKGLEKYYENAETCELNDKWNGLNVKFAYPKDKGYELTFSDKKSEFQKVTLKSKDVNCTMVVNFKKVAADEVTKRKTNYDKDPEKYTDFTEIEYAGFKGCSVTYNTGSAIKKFALLMLCEVEEGNGSEKGWYALELSIEKTSTSSSAAELDVAGYYSSEDFQNLLNSIQFTKKEPVKVDGTLGESRDLVVKTLTAPNDNYTVSQYPDTNGVTSAYLLKDGKYNGSGAYFRVYNTTNLDKEKFATLDKVLEYYQGDTWKYTYTDEKLADLDVKVEHKPKATETASKYSVWEAGFFEKDGKVYNFLYYRYEDVPEEIGTQLIKDVIANMYEYTEE